MRIGEVFALNKDTDIDFKSHKIYVNSTLSKAKDDKVILADRTKTYSGQRSINMDSMIIYFLQQAIKEYIPNEYNLLFCTENGGLMNEGSSNSAFKRFCRNHKVTNKNEINQHMLRHSYATRKIEGGMPAEILKGIMGHKDVKVTIDTYFDAFAEYKNVYEEKTYNYYEMNGLTYEIADKDYIISKELSLLLDKLNMSHLEDNDKEHLIQVISNIQSKYNKEKSNEDDTKISEFSNIIMFPAFAK